MTITLYGWGPMFDCPSPSPYVMKTEIQLQMLGLEFDRQIADLDSVPKSKAPYVRDGDVLIEDSNFIRAYFERKLCKSLNDGLSPEQQAESWAFERMVEGHISKAIGWERWMKEDNFRKGPALFFMEAPEPMREQICKEVLDGIAQTNQGEGFGRHSDEERLQLAAWDIEAIVKKLGGKEFLFGNWPTVADASVASFLISAATEYFDTPLSGLVRKHASLVDYTDRMKDAFFSQNHWPTPEMAMA